MSVTMTEIEAKTHKLAEARAQAQYILGAMQEGIDAIKKSELPKLRRAMQKANEHHEALKAMVEASPELFAKPKTVILHGIRVGYQKGKGSIVFDDADTCVAAIQKHLPDMEEQLIRWTGKPIKEALNQLDVATLKKIGCRVVDTGDSIVIKAVDSEFDKLAEAMMRDQTEEARVA